jgi:signal peptidase
MKLTAWWNELPGLVRDVLFVIIVVGGISMVSQITLGVWTPMVAVESGSMVPHMNIGDIIIVQGSSRTEVTTMEDGIKNGYSSFEMPGDVILYRPYGKEKLEIPDVLYSMIMRKPYPPDKATPIIHRAMKFVREGEPMWEGGPSAPHEGYITKGDHNAIIDQKAGTILGFANQTNLQRNQGSFVIMVGNDAYLGEGISYLTPVKKEWVIGVAKYKIPYIGYVRLVPGMIADFIKGLFGN